MLDNNILPFYIGIKTSKANHMENNLAGDIVAGSGKGYCGRAWQGIS